VSQEIHIIGAGLAGCEAAWQLAIRQMPVIIHEMRPQRNTEAHRTDKFAELVCSNSFRSNDSEFNAIGLLQHEMRHMRSLIMQVADKFRIPAGGALAVDREKFSAEVTKIIENHELIKIEREEIKTISSVDKLLNLMIISTGPLTSPDFSDEIQRLTGAQNMHFFDAISPVFDANSLDFDRIWRQSRYDKGATAGCGAGDYLNCGLSKEQYNDFIRELLAAPRVEFREWEKSTPYFEGCLPIEVMAERGPDTLRHGPMKPVGLTDPKTGRRPWAVVQLRQDNAQGTLWNMVGFQTKMTRGAQERVFRMIPGLENAVFARYGAMHRNTFINSPRLLDEYLRLKTRPRIRFAGQITGVEGYVESAAMGLLAGVFAAAEAKGAALPPPPPRETAMGALLAHITGEADAGIFQPMNVNFGLFPPLYGAPQNSRDRKFAMTQRAKEAMREWVGGKLR